MDRLLLFSGIFLVLSFGCRKPESTSPESSDENLSNKESGQTISPISPTTSSSSTATSEDSVEEQILKVSSDKLEFIEDGAIAHFEGKAFTGIATSSYPNGEIATEISYQDGMRHGVETRYHENGIKRFEGRFHQNQLVGVFEEWYPNGKKRSEVLWQDGKRVSIREWSETGEILRDN